MMVAGGLAYERGRNAQQAEDASYGGAAYDAPPPPPAPPAPAPSSPDTTSELERLASLHDSGALSDEEFASAKQNVLGG
jgi:hypothetical protein